MSRYIDAEKLKKELIGWETEPTDEDIERVIDRQPTADVISIKWIERSIPFQHPDDQDILISMIEVWRKGNDI